MLKTQILSFIRTLKKVSSVDEFSAAEWRFIIIFGAVSFLSWWYVFKTLDLLKWDPIGVRLGLIASAVIMVIISFYSRWMKKNLPLGFIFVTWLVTHYQFILVSHNHLDIYYIAVLFLIVGLSGHFHSTFRAFTYYAAFVLAEAAGVFWQTSHFSDKTLTQNFFFLMCGLTTNLSILFFSVTARRRVKAELKLHQDEIFKESKWTAMGKLAGTIAHEVNTPLAVISLSLEQLRDLLSENNQLNISTDKVLQRAESTTLRVAQIVKSLKIFSRAQDDDSFSPVKLSKLMEDTEIFLRQALRSTDVKFKITQSVEGQRVIICREAEILQVLVNLINNARDALKESETKLISLSVVSLDQGVQFTVEYTGAGLNPQPGATVGINISNRIAMAHGGSLTYERAEGRSRFKFWIPQNAGETDLKARNSARALA